MRIRMGNHFRISFRIRAVTWFDSPVVSRSCGRGLSTTLPGNLSFEWNGIFTQRVKGMGVTDFAPVCESEPVVDAICTGVVSSARTRALGAGYDREDRSSGVCHVGDTRQSSSEKDDDSIPHAHRLRRIVSHSNTIVVLHLFWFAFHLTDTYGTLYIRNTLFNTYLISQN